MFRSLAATIAFVALLAVPSAALAWQSYAALTATAAGVTFSGVELSSPNAGPQRCDLRVAVHYRGAKTAGQRLRVEVGVSGGRTVVSSFATEGPRGQHVFTVSTAPDGCWAADLQRPVRLSASG